jgi:hypothetical protein
MLSHMIKLLTVILSYRALYWLTVWQRACRLCCCDLTVAQPRRRQKCNKGCEGRGARGNGDVDAGFIDLFYYFG